MSLDVLLVPGGLGGEGGLAVDVRNLAVGLVQQGRRVGVVSTGSVTPIPGVEAIPLRTPRPRRIAPILGLHLGIDRVLRRNPRTVVHAFGCMPTYVTFAALLSARRRGNPVVWTPMFHPLRRRVWGRHPLLRTMSLFDAVAPRAARLADAVGAATEAEARCLSRAGARRVEFLPPVVESAEPARAEDVTALRERLGLVGVPLVVAVVSRDEPRKGLPFAYATVRALRARLPDARLLIVGLERVDAGIPDGVVLAGRVSDVDLATALRAADVVFVPSLFEAFSRVVIEAWQQETPVVVSDGVALAPTVAGGGGEVVPFGDASAAAAALLRLLENSELRSSYARAGAALVRERFLLDSLVDRAARLYDEVTVL